MFVLSLVKRDRIESRFTGIASRSGETGSLCFVYRKPKIFEKRAPLDVSNIPVLLTLENS